MNREIYNKVLDMAKKMAIRDFFIKELNYEELEDNGCVFENELYCLMVYFKPEMKIKCYPNIDYEHDWQDYYDSYIEVVSKIEHIEKCWQALYEFLNKKFSEFKIIRFIPEEEVNQIIAKEKGTRLI